MRLNLGAGGQQHDGWLAVDRAGDVDILLDLVDDAWPWKRSSIDGIVAHHVLDLLTPAEMQVVLDRCWYVLAPDAVLRVSNANLILGLEQAIIGARPFFAEQRNTIEETLGFFVTQGGARKQHLTPARLMDACKTSGFLGWAFSEEDFDQTVGKPWMTDLDSRESESWFAEVRR